MRITEFNKHVTASTLNESVAKQFGQKLNLESFTIEQLQNARNILRTKLSQQQIGEGFDNLHENEEYQQAKMFLDVINLEIQERDHIAEGFTDVELQVLQKVEEGLIDFESLPKSLQEKAMSISNVNARVKESILREGEEERAELIISAKDMVDKVTAWMEDTAQMQAEAMLDIVDAIRDELGVDMSHEFEAIVKPALAAVYTTLESSREQLTNSVNLLTGQRSETAPAGPAQPESPDLAGGEMMGAQPTDMVPPPAAEEPMAGAPEEELAGRPTRESIERGIRMSNVMSKKK